MKIFCVISKGRATRSHAKNFHPLLLRRRPHWRHGRHLSHGAAKLDFGPSRRGNGFFRLPLPLVSGDEIVRAQIPRQVRRRRCLRPSARFTRNSVNALAKFWSSTGVLLFSKLPLHPFPRNPFYPCILVIRAS